jgi:O-antigen/teichoic acid export membrane protein
MVTKLKTLLKSPLYLGLMVVSFGNIAIAFLNYYLNFLAQSLFPDFSDYGDFVFILTFLTLCMAIPASISGTLNLIVTELKVKNEFAKLTKLYIKMLVLFATVGLVFGLLIFSISFQITEVFKIQNVLYIQLLSIVIFLASLAIPHTSFLYGLLKFKSYVFIGLLTVLTKILLTVFFYNLGYGFVSILYALIVSILTSIVLGNILLISHFDPNYKLVNVSEHTKKLIMFSLPLFFIMTGSSILMQLDFIVLKSKLTTDLSGIYGYLQNFGKIFLFGSLIFTGAMAPQITESLNKNENYFSIFKFYSRIVLAIVGVGSSILIFAPKKFLDLFIFLSSYLGLRMESLVKFYEITSYIPIYTIFVAVYILISFLVIFLIATSTFKVYLAFIISALGQALLIFTLADDINSAIYCNLLVSILLLGYLSYEVYKKYLSFNHSSNL